MDDFGILYSSYLTYVYRLGDMYDLQTIVIICTILCRFAVPSVEVSLTCIASVLVIGNSMDKHWVI